MHRLDVKTMVLGPISTNTYICTAADGAGGPAGCFIVDPASDAPAIIDALGECAPTAILLTHGHFDHLMAVNGLRKRYPDVKVYAHPGDREIMLHPGRGIVLREFRDSAVSDFVPVGDGEILEIAGVKIEVIAAPGHSKGSVCYYIGEKQLLFSGDTVFRESYGRTDFESGDFDELKDSVIHRIFGRLKDAGHVDILPGHMEMTTLEHELKYNPLVGQIPE